MSVLVERMQLTAGAVTQLFGHLETLGLVERVRDPSDGCGVIVRPTPAAHEGYEASRMRLAELEADWRGLAGIRRWDVLRSVLDSLANWAEGPA